jgi:hypothetical protein
MTIRQRIIEYLQRHPEGVDDDELAEALELRRRQQANSCCRELEQAGLVSRRRVLGKIHNFLIGQTPAAPLIEYSVSLAEPGLNRTQSAKSDTWFWEGHVQDQVVRYLQANGWGIRSCADTASHQTGKDIVAEHDNAELWVTVKGYPTGTMRTKAIVQAPHWFKDAVFDIIRYRGENDQVLLAIALPDFPRYRSLAETIRWLEPVARFVYYWVQPTGQVLEEYGIVRHRSCEDSSSS